MALTRTDSDDTLLEELQSLIEDRPELAIKLLEINALRAEGEITDEDFAERRAELYR